MSSGNEENEEEPVISDEEYNKRCKSFAEITGTDTACAHFYLQDRDWDVERSVNAYFEDQGNKGGVRVNSEGESEVVIVVDGSERSLAAAASALVMQAALQTSSGSSADESSGVRSESVKEIKFISWNVDGLNEKNLKVRTKAVCRYIKEQQADIVFLQEVIPQSAELYLARLQDYDCIFGNDDGYFSGTLLKKSTVKKENHAIIAFPTSRMMRNILKVNIKIGGIPLCLMNVHLESTAEHSEERKCQLLKGFKEISEVPDNISIIFAGDMNLRDTELKEVGGLPVGVEDVWEMLGCRKTCSYTWDMTRNDNLIFNGKFKPRCRFDRVYFKGSSPSKIMPKFFGLIGLERLKPYTCFPSDHWGIFCHLDIE